MTRSPGLVPILFALGGLGVLAILAAAVAAPLGPRQGFMDGFMDGFMEDFQAVDMGSVELARVDAEARTRPAGPATDVDVAVGLQASNARDVVLRVLVSGQPCSRVGPAAEPEMVLASRAYRYEGVRDGAWTERLHARVPLAEGMPLSVYLDVEAANAVGPVFGQCVDLPPRPATLLPA